MSATLIPLPDRFRAGQKPGSDILGCEPAVDRRDPNQEIAIHVMADRSRPRHRRGLLLRDPIERCIRANG